MDPNLAPQPLDVSLAQHYRKTLGAFRPTEFAYQDVCRHIDLVQYSRLDEIEDQEKHLMHVDPLTIWHALVAADGDLKTAILSIKLYTDYLEQNNPRFLIGLPNVVHTARKSSVFGIAAVEQVGKNKHHSRRSVMGKSNFSMGAASTAQSSVKVEYMLSARFKNDTAEKWCVTNETRIKAKERKAINTVQLLEARIEEFGFAKAEAKSTLESFKLHFMRTERDLDFLRAATERKIMLKFRKWYEEWMISGNALVGRLRLQMLNVGDSCYRTKERIKQKEINKNVTGVDFKLLYIQREQLVAEVEEKFLNKLGLQDFEAKISTIINKKQIDNVEIEEKTHEQRKRIEFLIKRNALMEKKCREYELSNKRDIEKIDELYYKLENFTAPSVEEYMKMKRDIEVVKKEIATWDRKLRLGKIQKSNLRGKLKTAKRLAKEVLDKE